MSYKIKNLGLVTEVELFDEVYDAKPFIDDLKQIKGQISLLINSPGGSVFDGLAIFNYLNSIKERVDVTVLGLAASIASIIALGGRSLRMYKGTFFMIHNPWTIALGDSEELRKSADVLEKIRDELVKIYQTKLDKTAEEIVAMMDDETWLSADDCLQLGLIDELIEQTVAASLSKTYAFKNLPASVLIESMIQPDAPASEPPAEPQQQTEEPAPEPEPTQEPQASVALQPVAYLEPNTEENRMDPKNVDLQAVSAQAQDQDLTQLKAQLLSKPKNAALTLSDGYGVPTAVGGEILRLRDRGSQLRAAGARRVTVSTLTALTFNPNSSPAEYITGNYTDLTGAGTKITAVPAKLGGRYLAKEEVNDFSILNVMNEFKTDASAAISKGENKEFLTAILAKAGTTAVTSGAWTQAKIAEVYAAQGADFVGRPGAWFINSANLAALMAVQVNGAGSPLLFEPVYNSVDGRVGTLLGQPVYVNNQVSATGAGTHRLWYVPMDAVVIVDFNGGNLKGEAGTAELTNDLYINFAEYIYFDVTAPAAVVKMTFA